MAKKLITISVNLALTAVALLISLLLFEAYLRWVVPYKYIYRFAQFKVESVDPRDREDLILDPNLGPGLTVASGQQSYKLRRNMVAHFDSSEYHTLITTNELGLRGENPQDGAKFRILDLGDSFCMGYGVNDEETYSARLETLFRQQGYDRVEVINAGVLGYNALSSYSYLVEEGNQLHPDAVVLELWATDDVFGNQQKFRLKLSSEADLADHIRKLALESHAIMFAVDRMRSITELRRWLLDHGLLERHSIDLFLRNDAHERFATEIAELEQTLVKIQAYCDQHRIRFYLLLIPAREQIYATALENVISYNLREEISGEPDLEMPNKVVRYLAARHGINLLDMLETFRGECASHQCFFPNRDPHITAFADNLVAEALMKKLANEVAF